VTEPRYEFAGPVRCQRGAPPFALTLSGVATAPAAGSLTLTFSGAAPADLPATLSDASVEAAGERGYRIASGAREWQVRGGSLSATREVAAAFYRALPPRPVPVAKRFFWRLVLALAASRAGLMLLRALRR
jgi:hypothetical protein